MGGTLTFFLRNLDSLKYNQIQRGHQKKNIMLDNKEKESKPILKEEKQIVKKKRSII